MTRLLTIVSTIAMIFFTSEISNAQRISLNTYAGYALEDGIKYTGVSTEYDAQLEGGFMWGAGLEYIPYRSDYGIELLYLRQDTRALPNSSYNDSSATAFDVGMNYLVAAPNAYFRFGRSKDFFSYAGAMLGVSFINSTSDATSVSETKTNFAWGLRMGTRYLPSENISLNLTAQLLSTTQSVSEKYFTNSQLEQDGSASILQFGLFGGISYIFGE
jgi:opacity protein-like surface antigen